MEVNLEEFIKKFAEGIEEDPEKMDIETKLDSLLGWDSLGKVTFSAMVMSEYGISLSGDDLEKCKTINDLLDLIKKG